MEDIVREVRRHTKPVECPLLLISQVPRSGGTLLGQLFDGHPEVLAHPDQLQNVKEEWPTFDRSARPDTWFERLLERYTVQRAHEGYRRGRHDETHLFLFLPEVQRAVFLDAVGRHARPAARAIFDAYLTSYFAAWVNHHALPGPKRLVTSFVSEMATDPGNVERFFDVYPDGYLVQVIRSPQGWHASMVKAIQRGWMQKAWIPEAWEGQEFSQEERAARVAEIINPWIASAQSIERNRARFGERVIVVDFEGLVGDTEGTMRAVCAATGLTYSPALLTPTFNGAPLLSNTSFDGAARGRVDRSVLERRRHLTEAEEEYLDRNTTELHERVRALALAAEAPAEAGRTAARRPAVGEAPGATAMAPSLSRPNPVTTEPTP